MEREPTTPGVTDLGVASLATRGQDIPVKTEPDGYRLMGLLED